MGDDWNGRYFKNRPLLYRKAFYIAGLNQMIVRWDNDESYFRAKEELR